MEDGSWMARKNREIDDLMFGPNVVGETTSARFRWLGRVESMAEDRVAKRAYLGRPRGRRQVGCPSFSHEIHKDLKDFGLVSGNCRLKNGRAG